MSAGTLQSTACAGMCSPPPEYHTLPPCSSCNMLSAGHATMYLNERLVFGLAPESIVDVMAQRCVCLLCVW